MSTAFVYTTASAEAEEARKIALADHNAEIVAAQATEAKSGNAMINLRWKITEGNDQDKIVFDRIVFATGSIYRLDQFCAAIGRDPAKDFADTTLDVAFLTGWAESLLGEQATIKVGLDKGSTGDDGTAYPPKPEVKKYLPYGSAKSGNDLIDLD